MKWWTAVRALGTMSSAIAVTCAAHLAGGGVAHVGPLLATAVLLFPIVVAVSGRDLSIGRLIALSALLQACMHTLLSVTAGPSPMAAMSTGAGHDSMHLSPVPAGASTGAHTMQMHTDRMLVAHVIATLSLAFAVRYFDRCVAAVVAALTARLPGDPPRPLPSARIPALAFTSRVAPARGPRQHASRAPPLAV